MTSPTPRAPHAGVIAETLDQLLSHPFFRGPIGALLIVGALGAWETLGDIQREQQQQSTGIATLASDVGALKADFMASKSATSAEMGELRSRFDLLEARFETYERDSRERREKWDGMADQWQRDAQRWKDNRGANRRAGRSVEPD